MRDDTKERIDKLEAFMDEQKLKQAQQAAISEYKKERFHFWKELVLVACTEIRRWCYFKNKKHPGLVNRREKEYRICMKGQE